MQFMLQKNAPIPSELQRIGVELLTYTGDNLANQDISPDEAVHEARKSMKKLRALLRLVRDVPGKTAFLAEDRAIRAFAHQLSGARDSAILVDSLNQLTLYFRPYIEPSATDPVLRVLTDRYENAMRAYLAELDSNALQKQLTKLRKRLDKWKIADVSRDVLITGIQHTYRDGRQAWRTAEASPVMENIHAWRKQVKYLWYHCRLLHNWNPTALGRFGQLLDTLGETLGTEHDLALLAHTLQEQPDLCSDGRQTELIIGLAKARRVTLLDSAMQLADNVYTKKPGQFSAWLSGLGTGAG